MSRLSSALSASLKSRKKPDTAPPQIFDISSLKVLAARSNNDSYPSDSKKNPPPFSEKKPIHSNGSSTNNCESNSLSPKGSTLASILDIPWFSSNLPASVSLRRKEVLRARKQKWVFKQMQDRRFSRLIRMCAKKLGAEETLEVFSKLGRENGIKEYNALIELCVETARTSNKEESSFDQVHTALQLLQSMKEQGFDIEEGSYGSLLQYFVDNGMIEEFQVLSELITDGNTDSFSRVGYYEMLLWIGIGDDDKVQEMCNYITSNLIEHNHRLAENYLLALCKHDRRNELLILLKVVDVARISSLEHLNSLFRCFGRLSLPDIANKCISTLKTSGREMDDLSSFICNFATNGSNMKVDEVVAEFHGMHETLEVKPTPSSYCMLVTYCCTSFKVQTALEIVEKMCSSGLPISIETMHPIFRACEQTCDFDLVHSIYALMERFGLKPSSETYKYIINLCIKMKDFEGAFGLLHSLDEKKILPTASMYNSIMAGYFRGVSESCLLFTALTHPNLYILSKASNVGVNLICFVRFSSSIDPLQSLFYCRLPNDVILVRSIYYCAIQCLLSHSNGERFSCKTRAQIKDVASGFMILKKMEQADVTPDSETFFYLLNNAQCIADIHKYIEDMQRCEVPFTKHVFMALINGYVKYGQLEKAKQVSNDHRILPKNMNEIKSALLLAVASSDQMSEALKIYEEIKLSGLCPEAKAVIGLIEHTQSEGKLDTLLHFLDDLNDTLSWCDGCSRIILYCVQHKNLSCAIDLLKQMREKDKVAADFASDQAFALIAVMDPADASIGMSLLKGIKNDVGITPSRTSLDFLLSACLAANDADRARLIWREYKKAGIPFNILTLLRMYQVMLASGRPSMASKLLKSVREDDPHVRLVIKASDDVLTKYVKPEE